MTPDLPARPASARVLRARALLPLLAGGCLSMAPDYQRPAAPVPTTYEQAPTADAETPAAATVNWRDYYTDPILQDLIDSALRNNRDLRTALLRVEEARALYGIQRADQFPTIGVQADGSRARVPGDLNLTRQPQISSQYQVGVGMASWELDFWGRVRSLKDAALQNYLASDAAARAATLSLITQVADGYLTLRELDERLALTRATIASRAESLRIFKRRFEVGAISRLDLTQVETLWQQATALGADLEQSRAAGPRAGAAGGRPAGAASGRRAAGRRRRHARPAGGTAVRPAGQPSRHRRGRAPSKSRQRQHRRRPRRLLPSITLTGAYGTASAELDGLFDSGSRAWSFAPKLSLPIFDAGRRSAALDLAETRRDQAVAGYEKAIQSAFRDVSDALSARHWLAEQVEVLRATVAAQGERARLAQLRYDHGASPYLEVLDAQRDLLAAQQKLVQTRRALLSSRVGLYAALGGGTRPPALTETPTPSATPADAAPPAPVRGQ